MIRYLDKSILTTYIKELLKTINLPQCHIVSSKEEIKLDGLYIVKRDGLYSRQNGELTRVVPYKFNDEILNLTKTFRNTSLSYDSYTHKFLGEYLRLLRDLKDLDLMSMYNCFSNEFPTKLNLVSDSIRFSTSDKNYKIYMLPVKFGKKYTIAIDCDSTVELTCGFYDVSQLDIPTSESLEGFVKDTYDMKTNTIFTKPFVYDKLLVEEGGVNKSWFTESVYNKEKYLKLFIKLPINCNSSITVLEGDYIYCSQKTFENDLKLRVAKTELGKNTNIARRLQLLEMNTTTSYPFSDRLIEYIVENVIIPNDKIYQNIQYVQTKVRDLSLKDENDNNNYINFKSGQWDDNLSVQLKKYIQQNNIYTDTYDSFGFVDKDVEKSLGDDIVEEIDEKWQV